MSEPTNRRNRQAAVIKLALDRQHGTALDPSVPNAKILRESIGIVSRAQKFVSFRYVFPIRFCKSDIPATRDVIIRRSDIEWRRIRGRVRVRIALEPIHKTRALRNFMRDLSIFPLELGDEFKRRFRGGKIAFAVQCQTTPQRISTKKPRKSRPVAFAGSPVAGNQAISHG